MEPVHFKNFLGAQGTTLCGVDGAADTSMTLDPTKVTCDRCASVLGLVRDANIGLPSRNPKRDG